MSCCLYQPSMAPASLPAIFLSAHGRSSGAQASSATTRICAQNPSAGIAFVSDAERPPPEVCHRGVAAEQKQATVLRARAAAPTCQPAPVPPLCSGINQMHVEPLKSMTHPTIRGSSARQHAEQSDELLLQEVDQPRHRLLRLHQG